MLATVIIACILIIAVVFALRHLFRRKQQGKSCCSSCNGCNGCALRNTCHKPPNKTSEKQ